MTDFLFIVFDPTEYIVAFFAHRLLAIHKEYLTTYLARQPVKPVFFITGFDDLCQLFGQPRTKLLQRG